VAIGKEQGLELWSDGLRLVEGSYSLRLVESIGVVEKNKDWSAGLRSGEPTARREEWSSGVLGLKAGMDLIFKLFDRK